MPFSKLGFTFKTMYLFCISNASTLLSKPKFGVWGVFLHGSLWDQVAAHIKGEEIT